MTSDPGVTSDPEVTSDPGRPLQRSYLPGGGERQVDGAEEQIRQAQADHEGGGGVDPQLDGAGERYDGDQVTCRRHRTASALTASGYTGWGLKRFEARACRDT